MDGAGTRHTQVVIGGDGVGHVDIGASGLHQVERTADNAGDVLQVVSTVELRVFREDLGLDKLH